MSNGEQEIAMPHQRYTLRKEAEGTWSVIDIDTDLAASVRDRVLTAMPGPEAYDAAEMLNMIDSWRHEPAVGLPSGAALGKGMLPFLRSS